MIEHIFHILPSLIQQTPAISCAGVRPGSILLLRDVRILSGASFLYDRK